MSFSIQRYWVYTAETILALILPFITIHGNHIFLLNFGDKKLELAGIAFDMQELYLMPFLLMLLFIGIFAMTAVGGRVWCGWACPQTIFRVIYRDFIETKLLGLRKNIKNKQKEPDMSLGKNRLKRAVAILLWSMLALIAAADFMWYFVPPEDFFKYLTNPSEHYFMTGLFVGLTIFLIWDVIFIKEDFCIYICPYSRVQSVLYDNDTVMAVYDPIRGGDIYEGHGEDRSKQFSKKKDLLAVDESAECTTCESCVTVCPTHIDIRKGLQLECINCLECVDACTTVMGKLGKPSLVQWSSEKETLMHEGKTNFFRGKVLAYFAVLSIVTIVMFVMGSTKENMLLNINKTARQYKILPSNVVQNDYIFLFGNSDNKEHNYYFEVLDNDNIKILRPSRSFSIGAGKKAKKVIVLQIKDLTTFKATKKDRKIPITIRAYAEDDRKIFVDRESVFIYPAIDKFNK